MKDFSTMLIRCSALGSVMTKDKATSLSDKQLKEIDVLLLKEKLTLPQETKLDGLIYKRDNGEQLSKTCKTFLIQSYAIEKYYRDRGITTRPMVKGTLVEQDAINLFCHMEKRHYDKNKERISNEFISGTPDLFKGENIKSADEVIDIKSSWDIFTFLSNIGKDIQSSYYWQLQGYMALTGAKKAMLAYCLVNTPDVIIEDEKKRIFYKMNVPTEENEEYKAACTLLDFNMRFNDIPIEEKILRFTVERNDKDIASIYKKVEKCRVFLSEFQEQHLFFTKHHRKSTFHQQKTEELVGSTED